MSRPPQPGHPAPPPGHGPCRPQGPNNTPAFLAAGALFTCGVPSPYPQRYPLRGGYRPY